MTRVEQLKELLRHRDARPKNTDAFRWIDGELPTIAVDLFANVAVLSTYSELEPGDEAKLAADVGEAGALWGVYLKRRPKEARRAANESTEKVAPKLPLWGSEVDAVVVKECGINFEARPGNGLSVGLYLDARNARSWVRERAHGRTVLNLFSYTCGFGVAARLGGATRAVNVDLSRKVLDWGMRNLSLNDLEAEKRDFIAGDCFDWLGRFAKKNEVFDLVVLDPPSFASSGKSRFSAQKDYPKLVEKAAKVVAPGGTMLCCTNLEALDTKGFEAMVRDGLGARRNRVTDLFGASPVDFAQPSAFKAVAATCI
ncbi:MAG: class I SAM-dependent methyltransferase [Myxococcaceae bacterium]